MKSISNRSVTIILRLLENYLRRIEPRTGAESEERRKVIKAIKYLKK